MDLAVLEEEESETCRKRGNWKVLSTVSDREETSLGGWRVPTVHFTNVLEVRVVLDPTWETGSSRDRDQ